ncbi:MAG: hypothetical protein JWO87_3614, partial [Phycisphaerales bacterium]|nr:hypothetical protein [Phycisphaerales bacterium]
MSDDLVLIGALAIEHAKPLSALGIKIVETAQMIMQPRLSASRIRLEASARAFEKVELAK